jgi:hypothetical protein
MSSIGSIGPSAASTAQIGAGQALAIQNVRAMDSSSTQAGQQAAGSGKTLPPQGAGGTPPSRNLPRGSLLDLSV